MINEFKNTVNDNKFQELLDFGKIISYICWQLSITPILYWSLACFYHTQDRNMIIKDLDFLVNEDSFPELILLLGQYDISYELKPWQSIVISKDDLKIDIDSAERYLSPRSGETILTQIGDSKFNILNIISLIDIYQEAIDNMPLNNDFQKQRWLYEKKLINLKKHVS
ncbi:MAG: hypothetical protein ACD_3C00223G0005 [uncultured bacterium (gcode 4)]|uniref:Uncharacterized protein n=1 Tax=uncultured bacterium (gcode 4) TaxID=1234023 RepID=K2FWF3_9BACT|nr:MAG: hypothetical protein ACD_3C00223G0005 [uncultured bacterium (gcode 4)]